MSEERLSQSPDPETFRPNAGALRVSFQTFGCRSNHADTVDLQAALAERGVVPCESGSAADVVIINTCTVTDAADKDALKAIRRARARAPEAQIIVTGCMAEVAGEKLGGLQEVDRVIGPGRKSELLEAILGLTAEGRGPGGAVVQAVAGTVSDVPEPREQTARRRKKSLPERRSISLEGVLSPSTPGPGGRIGELTARARYHLRVQEGCENSCTFCIIPYSRGRLSSRPLDSVVDDYRRLSQTGYREIVLTGTHLGGYGEERGSSLPLLLEALVSEAAALGGDAPRIRLSSIDPNDVSSELIQLLSASDIFCRHLHICVQAFSDRTLKRMNRRYRLEEAEEVLWSCSERLPGCCIGSDVITGFPGESRQEVDQGLETFLRLPISYLHVFPYSERSNTAATRLDDPVPVVERRRRAARWRTVSERKRALFLKSLVGRPLEIIVEGIDEEHAWGTSREYAPVKMKAGSFEAAGMPPRLGCRVSCRALSYDQTDGTLVCQ